ELDPDLVCDEPAVEVGHLGHGLALQLIRDDRRGRLRDRAALTMEAQVRDPVAIELDVDPHLVAAQRVAVLELRVTLLQLPEVAGSLVVVEDELAVELVHQAPKIRLAFSRAAIRRSTSSVVL